MKKLYHEYFRIPENGKISDKVMLGRTVVAALCVILCLCAFSVSTYAYYYMTVSSTGNNVQAATFEVEVYLDGSDTPATADANGSYTIDPGTHTILLKPTGNVTKGFVVVEVAHQTSGVVLMMAGTGGSPSSATPDTTAAGTYCTPQLFDENGVPQVATFTLKTEGTVTLTPCWGEQKDYSNLSDKSVITATLVASDEAQLTNEEEAPADENQQEEKQEETPPSNEQESPDGENPAEGETPAEGEGGQPSNPANGENGQQGGEQQSDNSSDTTEVEGGQQSGETSDANGDDTVTGGDTTTGGDDTTGGEGTAGGETA